MTTREIAVSRSDQYSYDGKGNRLKAIRNGVETRYIYDAAGNLLAEADDLNNITRYYIHGLGLMAMVTDTNDVYTYHFNAVGSTIAMTDSGENIVNMYVYTPFGEIANEVEAVSQPFKFVGQHGVMTEPNGFYYMRARYYDPVVGRFISEDPLGFNGGGINLYLYALNNPITLYDPNGLDPRGWSSPYPSHSWNSTYSPAQDNPVLRCHVCTHNDPAENLVGIAIVGGPIIGVLAVEAAPVVAAGARAVATTVLANPVAIQRTAEFIEGAVTPGPPSTLPGALGYATATGAKNIYEAYKNYNPKP